MDVPKHFDVLEVMYCPSLQDGTYDVSESEFATLLTKARRWGGRPFEVDTKEYHLKGMVMIRKIEQEVCVETKVYQTTTLAVEDVEPVYRYVFMNKKKLSPVAFPSTKEHDAILYKRRTVFRINNRIYLNFEQERGPFRKIYVNYNHGKDADLRESMDTIATLLQRLFV